MLISWILNVVSIDIRSSVSVQTYSSGHLGKILLIGFFKEMVLKFFKISKDIVSLTQGRETMSVGAHHSKFRPTIFFPSTSF